MKEINIEIPEGFKIDEEKSTFTKIIFKPVEVYKRRDYYYIDSDSRVNKAPRTNK